MRAPAVQAALEFEVAQAWERLGAAPRVLDVGGGSGVWAVPLALSGCLVTVVDPSPNALATLHLRAAEAGVEDSVNPVQGDADFLIESIEPHSADLVLGHGVLEVVENTAVVARALADAAVSGGAVSVVAANRHSAVLARALVGRLADARRLLEDPDGRLGSDDPLLRRFDTGSLTTLLEGAGLAIERVQGDGVVSDLVPSGVVEAHAGAAEQLAGLELAAAGIPPLRDIASRLHVMARRAW